MQAFVLDMPACMPWCCEDEATADSEEMLDSAMGGTELHVPALWTWEILNAVGVAVKHGQIKPDRATTFLDQLSLLNFKIHSPPEMWDLPRLHSLAVKHALTAYDVAYLDLAKRISLPLATLDQDLKKAANDEGIEDVSRSIRA